MDPTSKLCPECGAVLAQSDQWGGVVWECHTHGLRDWFFEEVSLPGGATTR